MAGANRYVDSYNSRNYGNSNASVLDFTKLPKGKEAVFYKGKEGPNSLDIVSYVIKSKNHPLVHARKYKIGELDYRLDVYIHRKVGPGEATIICPKNTYGKPCPMCDAAEQARKEGRKEDYSAMKAKRTVFYNVIDTDEPQKGIQIFQVAHSLFEHELIEEAKNSTEDGSYVDFANEEDGWTVRCRGVPATTGTYPYTEYKGFKFIKRKTSIVDMIPETFSFDDLLIVHSAEKIAKLMAGADDEDEDQDDDQDVPVVSKPSPVRVVEKEPEPEPVQAKVDPDNLCPAGHEFGTDCDNPKFAKDCDKPCPVWKACYKASRLQA